MKEDKEAQKINNNLPYEIEAVLWKHTETLACGYMGIRCEENQNIGDSYSRISKEIAHRIEEPVYQKPLDRPELREKIAKRLWNNFIGNQEEQRIYIAAPNPEWEELKEKYPNGKGVKITYEETDQILALLDIKHYEES